jgi:hypothetical protein
MGKYLAPLGVFFMGNLALLIAFLLMPNIGSAGEQLATDTADMAHVFWNWTWVVGSVRLWVFLTLEFCVLWLTAKAFLKVR